MGLHHIADIALPPHAGNGGFDHAAVHAGRARLYVAHTANHAIDIIDSATFRYLGSVTGLTGIAGALVSEARDLVFTSNRGEDTIGIFTAGDERHVEKIGVGIRPNGLAYDGGRNVLLAANVGDPATPGSFSASLVDVEAKATIAEVSMPGRTRWAVFDPVGRLFYVNIVDPPCIAVVAADRPSGVVRALPVPAAGPHGLDLDAAGRRLFCACDGGTLVVLKVDSGDVVGSAELSGVPDVLFLNAALKRAYVAIGDPGVIDVFDADTLQRLETVKSERGAHTIGFDPSRNTVYAFLPDSRRAAVYHDRL
jgi:DNA-binding beta-propeller fold protein YncE